MGLEIQGAVNSMIGSARQIQAQNQDTARKALSIALGAAGGAATGGASGALAGAAKSAASQAGISGSDTLSNGVKGMTSGQGFMGGIRAAEKARLLAMESKESAQNEKRNFMADFNKMKQSDRTALLKDLQHRQSQMKRGGNDGTK